MPESIIKISDENFGKQVLQHSKPVIVDFCAPWCSHCKEIASTFDSLAEAYREDMIFGNCNVNENPLTANRLSIQCIPNLLIFQEGQVIYTIRGLASLETIKEAIECVLSGKSMPDSSLINE